MSPGRLEIAAVSIDCDDHVALANLYRALRGGRPALVDSAMAAGARVATHQPDPRWVVLLDPAGHPFCVTPYAPPSVSG
jgi:hypothetical protein